MWNQIYQERLLLSVFFLILKLSCLFHSVQNWALGINELQIRPIPLGTVFFQCLYNGTSSGLCVLGWDPVQALRARRCFWMCLEGCWMQTGCGSVAPQPVPASQKGQEGAETLCSVIKDWHRSHPWNHPMQNSESDLNGQEAKGKKTQSAVSAILKFFFKEYWLEILLQELKKW